ncbi:MAG: DUF711 family protein [Bacteroidetes bacterium]|nr:DUF711 family protein [Bacteroidota bacterium]
MLKKIIRTICLFSSKPSLSDISRLDYLASLLIDHGFEVQTRRLVSNSLSLAELDATFRNEDLYIGAGTLTREETHGQLPAFLQSENISFNLEITDYVSLDDVDILFTMIRNNPDNTFRFSYTFTNTYSSPFFPAARYLQDGFSIGLQPTDLAEGCNSLHTWLFRMKEVWDEIIGLFRAEHDFLGIDSSIAPMWDGNSSLVNLTKRIHGDFSNSVTSDTYVSLSRFVREENPLPVGLCGLMFPCLEDFELADEYETGNFTIERNIFLSLHSGLGIDTYPIGIDEDPLRVKQILNLLLGLSSKYRKPLSARFISDGNARIGQTTSFRNTTTTTTWLPSIPG